MSRADEIFTSGLESVIAQSTAIVTGPVVNFSKNVFETHAASGTPLRWKIQGEIRQPQVLKGDPPPPPIQFTRTEQALFIDQPGGSPWESEYLQWQTGDHALIFVMGAGTSNGMRVYPSGAGERDLASQVGRIVAIQSILDPGERFEAWRDALNSASAEEEKHAALRSLMSFEKPWSEMLPILQRQIASSDTATRTFIFDLVAYEIRRRRWPNAIKPADFLCERLEHETDEGLIERYLGSFGLLLEFAGEEEPGDVSRLLRERLDLCLRRLCLVAGEEAAHACEDLRTRYAR